jgi:hypothetical protein
MDAINAAMASLSARVEAQGPFTDAADVCAVLAAEIAPIVESMDRILDELGSAVE